MFRHEGSDRPQRHDQLLAGYLSLVAGFVNSAGFILIGSFTSHVTGNVGRFADDLAFGRGTGVLALVMVGAYFAGAFLASMALESRLIAQRATVYGGLLLVEAGLLGSFMLLAHLMQTERTWLRDSHAMLLCLAMGLQNSLVTRLSGAVVRTTHLTGVVTDLGIEAARWFRQWRTRLGELTGHRLLASAPSPTAPNLARTMLLCTIFAAFVSGSIVGALVARAVGLVALLVPTVALVGAGLFALRSGRELVLPVRRP